MLKYDFRSGVKKIKTKTAVSVSILGLGIAGLGSSLAFIPALSHAVSSPAFGLTPTEFVGTAAQCGGTAGTDTVTAQWDNSVGNPAPSIFLQKLGATENCASADVDITTPLVGGPVSAVTELNFDYQNGGWCGAGAPRFNLELNGTSNAFLGCNSTLGTKTDLGNGWTHVEFSTSDIQSAVTTAGGHPTDTLSSLSIVFDEGQTENGQPLGSGTVNIDNISVNGVSVGSPTNATSTGDCKNGGWQNLVDSNGNAFKNQGLCVAWVNHHDGNGQDDLHAHNR